MDDSSSSSNNTDSNNPNEVQGRSWLQRLGRLFTNAPDDKLDLMNALSNAQRNRLLDEEAINMIEGVMEVSEMRVQDVMIPRAQMVVVNINDSLEDIMTVSQESGHSRFPVINEDKDDIVGILLVKDLLPYIRDTNREFRLRDILRKARFIPESKRLNMLLSDFRKTRQHMAIVIDEFGGVAGVITIEDVIEEIIGDIDDEHDEIETPQIMEMMDDGEMMELDEVAKISESDDDGEGRKYWLDALYTIEDLNEQFDLNISDDKADTVGGLVAMMLGKVPDEGEEIKIGKCQFIVTKTAKRRIESLQLIIEDD